MKRLNSTVLAIGAICLIFQSAHATQLFSEGFNYTSGGNLGGNVNPGSGVAWTGNNNITIGNGNLTYPALQDLGGNSLSVAEGGSGSSINSPAFAAVTSGQIYYSFLLDITVAASANTYLTALNPAGTSPGGSGDLIDIYIDGTQNDLLRMRTHGASENSSGLSPALSLNTTYLVVLGYDFGTKAANLWLNPVAGNPQPAATESLTSDGVVTSAGDVGFKSNSGTGTFLVDNLLIGTTWADVTPVGVPEPSTFAFAALGLLGGFMARLRRR